jgi:Domain of unknown function (DUF6970)
MAIRDPRFRRLALCGSGPCLSAVLALVAPAVAGAPAPDLPDGLAARLRATTARPAGDTPPWVARYEYRGEAVYYFPPRCCDIPSELYDAAGNLVCRPDGGFVDGDERCPDFLIRRQGGEIVWPAGRGHGSPSTSDPDRGTSADTR